jgi:hypothetical protein
VHTHPGAILGLRMESTQTPVNFKMLWLPQRLDTPEPSPTSHGNGQWPLIQSPHGWVTLSPADAAFPSFSPSSGDSAVPLNILPEQFSVSCTVPSYWPLASLLMDQNPIGNQELQHLDTQSQSISIHLQHLIFAVQ